MSVHDTILGHLVGWGLSRRYEDAATEGLAFLLQRHPQVRERLVTLLRAAQPGLPGDLRFATQELFAAGRPDMCGRHGDAVRVLVESKFWAALTDNQPVGYLGKLAEEPAPTLLLFIVPERRRVYLWRELQERLKAAGIGHHSVGDDLVEISGRDPSQRLQITSWSALLKALAGGPDDDARANLEQLAGVCRIADDSEARPLVREELTDPQVPARMMQYVDIVRGVVDRGCPEVFRSAGGRNSFYWYATGEKIQFAWDNAPGAWLGVDLVRWRRYANGPLWLHFDWQWGQARVVRDRLEVWAAAQGRALCDTDEGVMLHLDLLVEREQAVVIDDVIAQLRTIGALLRGAVTPPAPGDAKP
ncbi:hypothetical protein [Nannocystis sp.]|uniref:hypothetical protein n=1 Tax=Nannocystis sp. TaxID=1962667 RepID=UPI0025E403DE|nr:hypothetical protein [Nannocystis sp.]MBK7829720.1 hypothetical protein [Nannocystis sp.]